MNARVGDETRPQIEIFRVGTHRDMRGTELSFAENDLQATASTYDPAKHEAPIVIGHPKSDAPAYGWINSLSFSDGSLTAEPHQVDPAFAEMVEAGRFKKVSAQFYTPTAPANPTPGIFSLKHVAFLGAQPPAVKGLKQVEFAEGGDDDVAMFELSFADAEYETGWALKRIFRMFRNIREFIIEEHGQERADKVVEGWDVDMGTEEAANVLDEAVPDSQSSFAELHEPKKESTMPSPKQPTFKRPGASSDEEQRTAEFAEREQALAKREADFNKLAIDAAILTHVVAGRILPAEQAGVAAFMAELDDDDAVSFAEGSEAETQRAFFGKFLDNMPQRVEFAEVSGEDGKGLPDAADGVAIGREAISYQEEQRGKGVVVTTSEAVTHVMNKGTS